MVFVDARQLPWGIEVCGGGCWVLNAICVFQQCGPGGFRSERGGRVLDKVHKEEETG
jgi:hypothetical protein